MCGIAGFFNLPNDPKMNITCMLDKIIHRGPDASGIWIDPCDTGVTLGHRRLSIMDLSENGSQPMVSHSRRYVLAYNGEIYNHGYLIDRLREDGYTDSFRGTSDTEILLEAMDFYGPLKAIEMCKGMFAIALYDRQEETLLLIRDRIGEKPLYYGMIDEAFVFASELGAITALEGFEKALNTDVMGIYMLHGYIPAPYSIYKNIYKLEPGTALKVKCKINKYGVAKDVHNEQYRVIKDTKLSNFSPEYTTYWSLNQTAVIGQNNVFEGSREEAAQVVEKLLIDSIRGQMISDVPLGAFLSAGIDSATVVSLMQSISDKPVKSFTIGFEDNEYNEADAAADIARYLGTEHTELYVTKEDALNVIPMIPEMFGEPFADSSQIPTYLVSKMTKDHVTVSLSGDGGDELFGGYTAYAGVDRIWNKISGIPAGIRTVAGEVMKYAPIPGARGRAVRLHGTLMGAKNPTDLYRRIYETDPVVMRLAGADKLSKQRMREFPYKYADIDNTMMKDPYHAAMLMDMNMYHVDDILVKVDRTSMAVSLESRVPMLDKDVVEFAWTLPSKYLHDGNVGKPVLRDILYKHVPRELMDRPKKGFSVPVKEWIKEPGLAEWAGEMFNPDLIKKHNILDVNAVQHIWEDYQNKGVWRPQIWFTLMLQSWLEANFK